MQKIENEQFYFSGFTLSRENSSALLKVAITAAENKEYGIATSLVILASEEAIKAILCLVKSKNPDYTSDFKELFKDHKVKHTHIESALVLYKIRNERLTALKEDFNNRLKELETSTNIPFEILEKDFLSKMPMAIQKFSPNPNIDAKEILQWWKGANDWKNDGLYVDIRQQRWHNPRSTNKKKFLIGKKYVEFLIDWSMDLYEMYTTNYQQNIEKK